MTEINKLIKEKSLYLQQHANNPVFWYPWCEEAFEIAKQQSKPIMLSVGYSACHWCHVMAHESFEDQKTADILNNNFINIKVDREERPDIDKIYQMSQSIITGKNGGWPLTIFMDSDKFPFFGGTYFPKDNKYGLPSFKDILKRVIHFYKNNQEDIKSQNINVLDVFNKIQDRVSVERKIDDKIIDELKTQLDSSFDTINGGFGSSPKFPHFPSLSFCINNIQSDLDRKKIIHTIDRMCVSGISDQINGGFFRYSVDDLWMIPHFEKMLYDNGPMMSILCDCFVHFNDKYYLKKAEEISDWAREFMTSDSGVFYSTIDADSDGEEGKYYVFTTKELEDNFNESELVLLNNYMLDLNKPNFEGNHHLHVHKKKEINFKEDIKMFDGILNKLSNIRSKKNIPGIDKKILLSWNCLFIKGMIKLYKVTQKRKYLNTIDTAINFICQNMVEEDFVYSCFNEEPCFPGYLDDYALLASALMDYLTINWNTKYYEVCKKLCFHLINDFEDKDKGGYFFTSNNHEKLFYRPKSISDDSIPSGLVLATDVLLQMGYLSGEKIFIDSAYNSIRYINKSFGDNMTSSVSAINMLRDDTLEREIIIIRTEKKFWKEISKKKSCYKKYIVFIDNHERNLPTSISLKKPKDTFAAYVCKGMTCSKPILSLDEFLKFINEK